MKEVNLKSPSAVILLDHIRHNYANDRQMLFWDEQVVELIPELAPADARPFITAVEELAAAKLITRRLEFDCPNCNMRWCGAPDLAPKRCKVCGCKLEDDDLNITMTFLLDETWARENIPLTRPEDKVRDLEAKVAKLEAEVTKLQKLAYVGEHHFYNLTYKAQLEELTPKVTALTDEKLKLEAERATMVRQRDINQADLFVYRHVLEAIATFIKTGAVDPMAAAKSTTFSAVRELKTEKSEVLTMVQKLKAERDELNAKVVELEALVKVRETWAALEQREADARALEGPHRREDGNCETRHLANGPTLDRVWELARGTKTDVVGSGCGNCSRAELVRRTPLITEKKS